MLGGKVDMTGFNALLRVSNSVPFFTAKIGLRMVPQCPKFLTSAEDSKLASFWDPTVALDLGKGRKLSFC